MAKDLLWELGVEEVPARFLPPVVKQLKELAEEAFRTAGLSYDDLRVLATPRRLTLLVTALAEKAEDMECISHRSVCRSCYKSKCFILGFNILPAYQILKSVKYCLHGYSVEVIFLTSGLDGYRNLVLFSCCKYEETVFRRFLKSFQKCIKCMIRKHVNFFYYVYFILSVYWNILNFFQNTLSIFNFSVTCGIYFDYINRNRICNIFATLAFPARVSCRSVFAV